MSHLRVLLRILTTTALLGGACSTAPSAASTQSPLPILEIPDDPSQPYVITVIDYHFHDAHPTPALAPSRTVIFVSEAENLHNVTIPGTSYSKDLPPGGKLVIPHIGSLLREAGNYAFYCIYHVDRGMGGLIIIQ